MQIDTTTLGTVVAVLVSVIASAVTYGTMQAKIDRIERDITLHENRFVPFELFDAIVKPIKDDIHEMRRDLKQFLAAVNKYATNNESEST